MPRGRGVREEGAGIVAARRAGLVRFRGDVYGCFRRRADAMFELVDAVLEADGPVESLVELSVQGVFRRGHGALYDALACGDIDVERLARVIASVWEPADEGPLKFAVDVSSWLRPDARTSPGRTFCHVPGRSGAVPGWAYSVVVGLEWGAASWSAPPGARRIEAADDATALTVAQVGAVLARLGPGAWAGRAAPVFAFDAGYDLTRIAYLTGQDALDVQILGRIRSDRVYFGDPAVLPGSGRPRRHGARFACADPATWPQPDERLEGSSPRHGRVEVTAWHALHQQVDRAGGWERFTGQLPVVPGTVIRIKVERLPGDRAPEDVWLWHHVPEGTAFDLDLLWKTYLRRFDLERCEPRCCHMRGSVASSASPSRSRVVLAA